MATTTDCKSCFQDALTGRERVRYFPRQLLTAEDMRAEQEFFCEKQRRHNRLLHGWGVVCGLEVQAPQQQEPDWQVTVCPGFVLTPDGDEVLLTEKVKVDVKTGLRTPDPCIPRWPCPPEPGSVAESESKKVYLAIRYVECSSRPVRVHSAGCGCDESACEYSRVRDSFELRLLSQLPDLHKETKVFYGAWCESWKVWSAQQNENKTIFPLPVPPCRLCPDDPWVVLATVTLPTKEAPRIVDGMISYEERLPLYGSTVLQILQSCK